VIYDIYLTTKRCFTQRSSAWRTALALTVLVATLALAGCGSSDSSLATSSAATTSSAGSTGAAPVAKASVRIALDYSANVDYLGVYAAITNGYFAQQGIKPTIIPYANTPAEPLVESGKTDLGITYPPDVIINRSQGLKYRAVAALVDGNTTALAVLASSKFTRPAQLSGQLYGGFGVSSDPPIISTIMRNDGVAKPDFKQVVLNTDVITALSQHRIGYTAVFGGIDDVTAALQGIKLRTFPYQKYLGPGGNYPNAVFAASDAEIATRAAVLRRTLKALALGYEFAAHHPAAAEQILIKDNPTALAHSRRIIVATGNATAPTFVGSSGNWGTLYNSDFSGLETILSRSGVIKGTPPPVSDLYTNSLLPNR
jgi:ABC-type nitrate/sulfonate/bicarbonate transport system substrate-binding protein